MEYDVRESHPSYGAIQVVRQSGGRMNLFGSSIVHSETIVLTISRAERLRSYHHERHFPKAELIEVEMSPVQFAEMITHLNCGSGTPCTIAHVGHERMPECPAVDERQLIEAEFDNRVKKVSDTANNIAAMVVGKLTAKGPISAADRKEIAGEISRLIMEVRSNLPFTQTMFNETIEKTVSAAKGEVEAFVEMKIRDAGLQAISQGSYQPPMLQIQSNPTPATEQRDG